MAERQLTCTACGKQFIHGKSGRKPRACSDDCKRVRSNQWHRDNRKAPSAVKASMLGCCEGCGQSGQSKSKGLCKTCTADQRRTQKLVAARDRRGLAHLPPLIRPHGAAQVSGVCIECGYAFCVTHDGIGQRPTGKYCGRKCGKKNADRISSRMRRAKTRGSEAEPVDYNEVFARDAWRCQICRAMTLKSKRGAIHPKAPVIDHIVPLSQGGKHTRQNLQCACHSCNSLKGAGAGGQLLLFG